ncbi:hypothetical protein ACQEWB_10205 [Streptomyces sp. CA-249302]|uniref:hypothetical protein n=1 Tax=Streptomyces sp. CA-249302 TaxID=3240058 RepID=UPI003D8F73EC
MTMEHVEPDQDGVTMPVPTTPSAASIAETVGTVLAQTASVARAGRPEDADEIEAITAAMVRLLVGIPMRSDGKLTVKSLAEEADLKRNKLTHKYTHLKDLFYALVRTQETRPKVVDALHHENNELKRKLAKTRLERDQLKDDVKLLSRVIHVLEVENYELRSSADENGVIRVLPMRRATDRD